MLEFGVDEITLVLQVLQSQNPISSSDWKDVAEHTIWRFEKQADLKNILGRKNMDTRAPEGYKVAYTYGEHSFYFAVAYHDYQSTMGVVVKFSAQALDYYLEKADLTVYQFLQKVVHTDYSQRLSRLDLTVDYIDEDIDITDIYQSLMDSKVALFRGQQNKKTGEVQYRKVPMIKQGYLIEQEVQTIYVGSYKSNSRLRIYDKKQEQIVHKGSKLEKALNCKGWVRFEAVMRNEYAHQLSSELMKIQTDDEFANLIAHAIAQKYRFMEVDNGIAGTPTEYTQMILDCLSNQQFQLKANATRNYALARSIAYIFSGSGIMNTLYKLKEIWGLNAVIEMLEYMLEALEDDFKPNDECRYWLNKNCSDYKNQYKDFDTYMKSDVKWLL